MLQGMAVPGIDTMVIRVSKGRREIVDRMELVDVRGSGIEGG